MSTEEKQKTNGKRTPEDDARIRDRIDEEQMEEMRSNRQVEYTSLETNEPVKLTLAVVKRVVATPTRGGKMPSDADCFLFMKLCQARRLNPLVGDAYLIGFDTKTWSPGGEETWTAKFNIIVAHSALLKRAEASGEYNGMESGVIVQNPDGSVEELVGDFYQDSQTIVGAWAKAYRKDREIVEYDRLRLDVYNSERSRWSVDPGGMIVKVAEASVLRRAFPGETAGMYVREEFDRIGIAEPAPKRKFEVEDIGDGEDRLKKTKPKATKRPKAKTKAVKAADPVEEPLKADVTPENESDDKVVSEPETSVETIVDDQPRQAELPIEVENEDGDSPVGTVEVDEVIVTNETFGVDIDTFKASIQSQQMIRKVRSLRDEFIAGHQLTGEQRAEVEVAAKEVEDRLRAEMAG